MSALSKLSGSRSHHAAPAVPYDDLREKVAALFRPERNTSANAVHPAPRVHQDHAQTQLRDEVSPPIVNRNNVESTIHDLGSACNILNRATSCFELLTQKIEQVEGERDDAVSQIEEHKHAISTWQEMIETAQARMRDAERDLAALRQEVASQNDRANAAEDRAAKLENTLKLRDRRMGELERNYTSLHDQVMSSFGTDSQTYRALETLVDRFRSKAA